MTKKQIIEVLGDIIGAASLFGILFGLLFFAAVFGG